MCGITGYWQMGDGWGGVSAATAEAMALGIVNRGPDDAGVWIDKDAGIALAHRRLSVLELSMAGHQPMVSPSGRFVLVFNGEIYNHLTLRKDMEGRSWRGHSDTETLLSGFEAWGVEATVKKSVGMFAFALWDRVDRVLTLARDRIGEKPVYYGWQKGVFLFGSELKALKAHPAFCGDIDRDALTLLLRYNCIPAPYSIYKGICKLLPATVVQFAFGKENPALGEMPPPKPYWSLSALVEHGLVDRFAGSDSDAVSGLETRLKESVGLQMIADVPLGVFLSGGVDSSTIVALMQAQATRPVKTFTIGFSEQGYNEATHAKAVARHLGTEHNELYVTPSEAQAVIPHLPGFYDEPFSDSSQIPTFLVSRLARQHVTVSLSGDGGDELFGGYNRHVWANSIWRVLRRFPVAFRKILAASITTLSPKAWDRIYAGSSALLPPRLRIVQAGEKAHKLASVLSARSPEETYWGLVSHWETPTDAVVGSAEPPTLLTDRAGWPVIPDPEHRMMYLDAMTYLPDDILVKVDRAAMGVSLETRAPFLDHRVMEFAWCLPLSMKIREGRGKWILRQVLYKYVPRELIERPKMGFGMPIDAWLRGPLREWAEALLDDSRLRREGFFRPEPIRRKWREHLSGVRNWQYHLWDVLMFQAWLDARD